MTYLFSPKVDFISQNMDAAARLRVSSPMTLFEHSNQYGTNIYKFDTLTSGTGTITEPAVLTTSATTLSTGGTASGAQAIRASRAYMHYATGKSLVVGTAFQFGTGTTNCSQRVGYYDANNGAFLQQIGTALSLVIRSNASGSVVDNTIAQASFNIDTLGGTGPSGITWNGTASQNLRIDLLGSTSIRFYLYANGRYWLFHQLENQTVNSPTVPSPVTPNLTVRTEVVNTGTAGATCTMLVTNQSVTVEGSETTLYSSTYSGGNGGTTINVTATRPICSIRANTTGPGRGVRNFGQIIPLEAQVYTAGSMCMQLVYNGTLTGASFSAVSSNSLAMVDTSATAITGGIVVSSQYVTGASGLLSSIPGVGGDGLALQFPFVYSSLNNTQDTLTLVANYIATGATAGNFTWAELW